VHSAVNASVEGQGLNVGTKPVPEAVADAGFALILERFTGAQIASHLAQDDDVAHVHDRRLARSFAREINSA